MSKARVKGAFLAPEGTDMLVGTFSVEIDREVTEESYRSVKGRKDIYFEAAQHALCLSATKDFESWLNRSFFIGLESAS